MKYKLISVDIDGTLIPYHKPCPQIVTEVMEELAKNNVLVVPNTGRPLVPLAEQLPKNSFKYAICGNGSSVIDIENNKLIYEANIDSKLAAEIIDFITPMDQVLLVFMNDLFYADKRVEELLKLNKVKVLDSKIYYVENISKKIIDENLSVQKLVALCEPNVRDYYKKIIQDRFKQVKYFSSSVDDIEMNNPLAGKDIGLKKLCEYLNIGLDEVIVMGDNDNDLPVLTLGCYNIVPENGNDNAKKYSSIISASCEEGGPMRTLKQMYDDGLIEKG